MTLPWLRLLWVVTPTATPPLLRHRPGSLSGAAADARLPPPPLSRALPSPVSAAARPSARRWPGPRARVSVPGSPAMGCIGSWSPAGQGKRRKPGTVGKPLLSPGARASGGWGPWGRGRCREREEPALGRRARQQEGVGMSGEGAKPTPVCSCGLPASALHRGRVVSPMYSFNRGCREGLVKPRYTNHGEELWMPEH